MCKLAESQSENLDQFLRFLKKLKRREPHLTKIRVSLTQKAYQEHTLADFQSVIDEYIRSKNSGIAFSLISLVIVHPILNEGRRDHDLLP